jgi:hypothetical protein
MNASKDRKKHRMSEITAVKEEILADISMQLSIRKDHMRLIKYS